MSFVLARKKALTDLDDCKDRKEITSLHFVHTVCNHTICSRDGTSLVAQYEKYDELQSQPASAQRFISASTLITVANATGSSW